MTLQEKIPASAIGNQEIGYRLIEVEACRVRLMALLANWAVPRQVVWLPVICDAVDLAQRAANLRDDGILMMLSGAEPQPGISLGPAWSRGFGHVASYFVRPVEGMLLSPVAAANSRLARLQAGDGFAVLLHVCSHWPAPPLPLGLLEQSALPAGVPVIALPTVFSGNGAAKVASSGLAADGKLVALAERIMAMEVKLSAANFRAAQLEYRLSQSSSASEGQDHEAFDVPRDRHGWRLAEHKDVAPASLGRYERRVDDPVILEARAGDAFLAQWHLLADPAKTDVPDFAGASRCLAEMPPLPGQVADVPDVEPPDVSIVIPVYGQLAYTLNCLHSLLQHQTRASFEIIIIDDCSPDQTAAYLPQIAEKIPHLRYHRRSINGGFIAAANQGGLLARGRYLVMLNNDTRVVAGWLDALIEGFAQFPKAGLIGSKLHFGDGSLQEAGAIIWRDGSCWNYGCRDDPNRPQYCYAREVDYISGCSIAIKASLWREMEGFDPHFAPAYCEDADLCLRLAERGYQIWFQPQSRVVHYEGKTSGTDTGAGVKAYQVINTKKLYLRWRERLLDHRPNATAPYFERERKVNRRMLVVDAVAPTPKQDAGSVQTVLVLKVARDLGYKVHFVPEDNWLFEPAAIPDLQAMGIDCAYAPYELGFDNYLRRYGFLFDVIMVFRVTILDRTIEAIEKFAPQATLLYHVADLFHLRMARQAALDNDRLLLELAEKTKGRELALARRAHGTITHSLYEAGLLAKLAPEAQVMVWPLMFDFFGTEVGYAARSDICFLGGYRHPPNVDAVQYFVAEIWPLVAAELPGVRFIIAGANPTPDVLALSGRDIVVTGMIDDLRDLFDAARVFVAPLRVGAGVKGKLMSAMSYGVPVVSTAIGIEGTELQPEQQVLVGETPAEFAAQILRVYRDRELWNLLSAAGQAVMRERFSPGSGAATLARAIDHATYRRLGIDIPDQTA